MRGEKQQMLRSVSPELYWHIMDILGESNIHPNDIEARAIPHDDGIEIFIGYGEDYSHSQSSFISNQAIEQKNDEIKLFIDEVAEECQEVMIADYFKMMKM